MQVPTRTRSALAGLAALALAVAGLTLTNPAHAATPDQPDSPPVVGAAPAAPTGRLTLSGTEFDALGGPCGGSDTVSPATITASVTVTGAGGSAVVGLPVDFAVDAPLFISGDARVMTDGDGLASVTVGLNPSSAPNTAVVPAVRAALADGPVEGSPTGVSIRWLPYHATSATPEVAAAPSAGAGPVAADGSASWTITAFHWLGCEKLAGARFGFTVETGGALLSAPSTGETGVTSLTVVAGADGLARVTVTDATAELVTISVQPLSAKLGTTLSGAPVTVEFVKPASGARLTVDPAQFTVPLKGASTKVTVTSTDPWQLNCHRLNGPLPGWLHEDITTGPAGTSVVTITADPSPLLLERHDTLLMCAADQVATITVDQTGVVNWSTVLDQLRSFFNRILALIQTLFTSLR